MEPIAGQIVRLASEGATMWFTEDAVTPCAVFGVFGLIALIGGWNGHRRASSWGGLLLIAIGASAFAIDHYVTTDREEIELLIGRLCDDFRHKRGATLDYFSANAPGLRATAVAAMALVTVEDGPRLTDFDIRISNQGSQATAHFRANATISVKGLGNVGYQPSRFILTWNREQDAWKIVNVQRMHVTQDRELELLSERAG